MTKDFETDRSSNRERQKKKQGEGKGESTRRAERLAVRGNRLRAVPG